MISVEKLKILTPYKSCPRMWEIWAKKLLPKALKTCPKFNKSPNLVTLVSINPMCSIYPGRDFLSCYLYVDTMISMLTISNVVRLIVDTGIHAYGWSKEKAVSFIIDNTPAGKNSAEEQVTDCSP